MKLHLPESKENYSFMDGKGSYLLRSHVNAHHSSWERAAYVTKREKLYRNMAGMVLMMTVSEHSNLHANIRQPVKPSFTLMNEAIDFNFSTLTKADTAYHNFEQMIGFFSNVAETSPHLGKAEEANKIASNFIIQSAFIERGRVTPL